MKKKLTKLRFLWLLAPTFLFSSCYYYPDDLYIAEDQLVAITQYDQNCNFKQFQTFSIADCVISVGSNGGTPSLTTADQAAINEVIKNMESRGYTQVTPSASVRPDLEVSLYSAEVVNVSAYYPGYWWDYFYPYYYDYWDWYPYYYYPYYSYGITTGYAVGTLVIKVSDLKNATVEKAPVRWIGMVRGVMTGGHTIGEIQNTIDECFNQAPDALRRN